MAIAVKRIPLNDEWARGAYCKGKDPALWDLDSPARVYRKGRRHCITDCVIREKCLRKALHEGAEGVVRGGILFDTDQHRKKKTRCLFCQYPVAPIKYNEDLHPVRDICWVCRRYAQCLKGCGRMVRRRPYIDSYYCNYCSK